MNSREKGCRGEREAAATLNAVLGTAFRRGVQYAGGPESPDITGALPGVHFEVKRVERLNVNKAMSQAIRDSNPDQIPAVMHRTNRNPWLVTLHAENLIRLLDAVDTARAKLKPEPEKEDTQCAH